MVMVWSGLGMPFSNLAVASYSPSLSAGIMGGVNIARKPDHWSSMCFSYTKSLRLFSPRFTVCRISHESYQNHSKPIIVRGLLSIFRWTVTCYDHPTCLSLLVLIPIGGSVDPWRIFGEPRRCHSEEKSNPNSPKRPSKMGLSPGIIGFFSTKW